WLIEANIASTGKPHLRNGTPSCLLNFRALNALSCKRCHLGFQVVAHEIELVGPLLRGVECGFGRRQGEDQPAMTRIHGFEPEDVAEKGAVRRSVFTVDNYVSAGNHFTAPKKCRKLLADFMFSQNLENPNKIKLGHYR